MKVNERMRVIEMCADVQSVTRHLVVCQSALMVMVGRPVEEATLDTVCGEQRSMVTSGGGSGIKVVSACGGHVLQHSHKH